MHLSAFNRFLGAASLIESIVLLYVLFFRDRAKTFPIFTTFIAFTLIEGVAGYTYSHLSRHAYYYTYWSLGAVDVCLQIALVYEIAWHVFAPLKEWAPDVRAAFVTLVCGSVAIAVLFVALASPAETNSVARIIGRSNFFADLLLTEMFAGLVILSAMAGLPWRTHVARIAQGAGAFALVSVLSNVYEVWLSWKHDVSTINVLWLAVGTMGRISFAYWIVALWRDAPEPREIPEPMRGQIVRLTRQLEYDLGRIRGWRKI